MLTKHLLAQSITQGGGGSSPTIVSANTSLYVWGLNSSGQLGDNSTVNKSSPTLVENILGGKSFAQLVTGTLHNLAIDTTGSLWVWGDNTYGQLGDNTTTNRPSPIQIVTGSSFTSIGTANNTSFATDINGKLWSWGDNSQYQVGDGTTINRSTPTQIYGYNLVSSYNSWKAISVGNQHTLAIKSSDSSLWAWGYNVNGQLGDGTTVSKSSPIQIGTSSWSFIAAGVNHSVAVTTDGILWAWGQNNFGQLGDSTLTSRSAPVKITTVTSLYNGIANGVRSLSAGVNNTGLIDSTGQLWTTGQNTSGQLGNLSSTTTSRFAAVGSMSWSLVSMGYTHSLATTYDTGTLYAWGDNTYGQLGDGTSVNKSSPVVAAGSAISSWKVISTKANGGAAIKASDSSLWVWGLNGNGILGDGTTVSKSAPVQLGNSSWAFVRTNTFSTVAIDINGRLFTWGSGSLGLLGDGTTVSKSSPVLIGTSSWAMVDNGTTHMVGITADGSLYAWGQGTGGLLGDNTSVAKSSPVKIGSSSWSIVAAGVSHTLAIDINGRLFSWGSGASGNLGSGATIARSSPVQIGTSSWKAIGAGRNSIGITLNGSLFTWGSNASGALGDGTTINKSSPVLIGSSSWSIVSAGNHTIDMMSAIDIRGRLFTWGSNASGSLGDGTTVSKSSPVQVSASGVTSWNMVATGGGVKALDSTGGLWSWGSGANGQIGDGTTVTKSSPILLPSGYLPNPTNFNKIFAGYNTTFGIANTNILYASGINDVSQLGDGTTVNKSAMTQIGTSSWTAISGTLNVSAGITTTGGLYGWGVNNYGSVLVEGFPRTTYSTPQQIPATATNSSWRVISGSNTQMAAIRGNDGSLWTWGNASNGTLGDGTTIDKSTPVKIGTSSWTSLATNGWSSAAVDINGRLFTWGFGMLGDTLGSRSSPVQIGTSSWTATFSGPYTSNLAAIRADGGLFMWGFNSFGQLGDGTTIDKSSPVQIGTSSWAMVSLGLSHALGITASGQLYSWGSGVNGMLGDGTTINKSSPVQIGSSSWSFVSSSDLLSYAIDINGRLFGWGSKNGVIGDYAFATRSSPVQIGSDLNESWSMVFAGAASGAITTTGKLYTWGKNNYGQFGIGNISSLATEWAYAPVLVGNGYSKLFISSNLFVTDLNGNAYVCGLNSSGQLGDGTTVNKSSPVSIVNNIGTSYSSWTAIGLNASAGDFTAGITTDGALWTWGRNPTGQLGNLSTNADIQSPQKINSLNASPTSNNILFNGILSQGYGNYGFAISSNTGYKIYSWGPNAKVPTEVEYNSRNTFTSPQDSWKIISAGKDFILAIKSSDSSLWSWGLNSNSQLGLNLASTITKLDGAFKVGNSSWSIVSAGNSHAAAIDINGRLYGWGLNSSGQLGDGTTIAKSSPVQIGTSSWSVVNAGLDSTSAIDINGNLWSWGKNNVGQLGIVSTVNKSSPTQVPSNFTSNLWKYVEVMNSINTIYAIRSSDSSLWGWGDNTNAVIDSSEAQRYSPVQISSSSWSVVSAGSGSVYAIDIAGRLFAWGANNLGQLGDGTTIAKSSPVQIGSSSWSVVAANYSNAAAIDINGRLYSWGTGANGELGTGTTQGRSSPVQIGTSSWSVVASAGAFNYYAIDTVGRLFSWGRATQGALGDGTTIGKSSPVQIGTSSWTKIGAYDGGAHAIDINGRLFGWGNNLSASIGDGTNASKSSPVQIGSSSWTFISKSNYTNGKHGIDITGALWAWGGSSSSMYGNGSLSVSLSPTKIGSTSWSMICESMSLAAAIDSTGNVYTWGIAPESFGDYSTATRNSPVAILYVSSQSYSSWSFVSSFSDFTAGITTDGALWTWGNNALGVLGDGTTVNKIYPVKLGTNSWNKVSAGVSHVLAINNSGNLWTWGQNNNGQLGDGTTINKSSPVQIGTSSWTTISGALNVSAGITTTGGLFTWGLNSSGQLGDGTTINKSSPVQIGTSSWSVVNSMSSNVAAVDNAGRLFVWGSNSNTQLGDGTTIDKSSPVLASTYSINGFGISKITTTGTNAIMFLDKANGVSTFGNNSNYEIGDGSTTNPETPIKLIDGSLSPIQKIGSGYKHNAYVYNNQLYVWGDNSSKQSSIWPYNISLPSIIESYTYSNTSPNVRKSKKALSYFNAALAIDLDGALWGWGNNSSGQLGDGTTVNKSSPVQIGTNSWTMVSVGISWAHGIDYTGALWGWGNNIYGMLGDATTAPKSSPVQIGTSSWIMVADGQTSALGITTDGALWTWGLGSSGQIGNGLQNTISSPVQIGTSSWIYVSAGISTVAAIDINGRLFTWGGGLQGQLGDGTIVSKSSPVQVAGTNSWSVVSIGGSYVAAIDINGALWTWGSGSNGVLGDGTTIGKSSPVQIGTSSWTMVEVGANSMAAIDINGRLFTWGNNILGQLGDGTIINKSSPVQIGTSSWTMVAMKSNGVTALDIDGYLWVWGNNTGNILPLPTRFAIIINTPMKIPKTINSINNIQNISLGYNHTIAANLNSIGSYDLYSFGDNTYGQLGNNTTNNISWATITQTYNTANNIFAGSYYGFKL